MYIMYVFTLRNINAFKKLKLQGVDLISLDFFVEPDKTLRKLLHTPGKPVKDMIHLNCRNSNANEWPTKKVSRNYYPCLVSKY